MEAITFYDILHGFWGFRGTGTAALKANLLQQRMTMREAVLFEVFLDLQKADADLDQDRCREIIAAYGVGPRVVWLLQTWWPRPVDNMSPPSRGTAE